MILADTSAWVEFVRRTGSAVDRAMDDLIDRESDLATTEVVVMEVLAGGRDEIHTRQLRRLIGRCTMVPVEGLDDYEAAAALYRRCRRVGVTIRSINDCLVAAVALRAGLEVLHADRDFEALALHTGLRVVPT